MSTTIFLGIPRVSKAKEPLSTEPAKKGTEEVTELHESPYTLPNALTLARIAACPFLGYAIVEGHFELATGILVVGGFTDWLDGFLARRWNQKSVLGSILDPMADKALMTTLVVTLTYKGLLPLPLAVIIFGRDLALSLWAFYLRYQSIPPPRTLKRYFDVSMPSAEVQPTQISKINTALQLLLMGITTISPMVTAFPMDGILQALQWTVAVTTIWSGFSYVGASGYKFLKPPGAKKKL
ncbi:Cardiolipin synthase (CMP-forming) [Vanrija pseudolonga]|uniref:Cardiolipin synthase (CMP-forming) n=1 Tax=Vanrija pseudolonga TaxID=143232 RepID=A0AAF1BEM3_9TREE|nr:Cardiolipin synthase (CMP-forming) [Vanrija pseudolonga]